LFINNKKILSRQNSASIICIERDLKWKNK